MARDLTSDFITALTQKKKAPILLMSAYFDSGTLSLWNGLGNLSYGGITYTGVIPILSIDKIKEQKNLAAAGVNITLGGLDDSILEITREEPFQQRSFEMYVALLDSAGAIVSDPYLMFEGFMDQMITKDDAKTVEITVAVENALISLERALDTKYTPEDQKREFPNDSGFDFVTDIQNKQVIWG